MLTNYNKLFIQNFKLIMIPDFDTNPVDDIIFDAFIKEVNRKGFKFSDDLMDIVKISDVNMLNSILEDLDSIPDLEDYKPLISSFSAIDDKEIVNFISKFKEADPSKLTELNILNRDSLNRLFTNFIKSNSVWSNGDRESLLAIISLMEQSEINDIINNNDIPMKENASYLTMNLYTSPDFEVANINSLLKTSTDVLRFALELQGQNLNNITEKVSFKFSNKDKRTILSLLNRDHMVLDMFRNEHYFKLIAGRINPMTKQNKVKYPKTYKNFKSLLGNNKPDNWGRKANDILVNTDQYSAADVVEVYSERPGEFSRVIRTMVSKYDPEVVISGFSDVAVEVAPKALIELYNVLITPNYSKNRITNIKNKLTLLDDSDIAISDEYTDQLVSVVETALMEQFSTKEELGKLMIDPRLFSIPVPLQERESASGYKNLPKLSRIAIPEDVNEIRTILRWFNGTEEYPNDRIDIDLSTIGYSEDFTESFHCRWNTDFKSSNRNGKKAGMIYSGDEVDAPNGATEFNDIDIAEMLNQGYRYVVSDLRSYTGQPYSKILDAAFGIQFGVDNLSAKFVDLSKVEVLTGLNNDAINLTLFILDLEKRELLYVNSPTNSTDITSGNYDPKFVKALYNLEKLSIGDLLILNTKARNGEVISKEDYESLTDLEKEEVKIFNLPGSEQHEIENSDLLANFL